MCIRDSTNIVQQSGPFGKFGIEAQFRSHQRAQVSGLAAVHQQVLAVAAPEAHAAYHPHKLFVQAVDAKLYNGTLAYFHHLFLNLLAGLFHHFLYPSRVYAAVAYKTLQAQAGRELRVIVEADKVPDADSEKLSFEIAQKIQTEMTYPGQIKVTVIREKRTVNIAR